MIRVLIADDDPLLRAGLVIILSAAADIDVVAEATDGASAVEATRRTGPDVALLDIRMPGVDGLSAARTILAALTAGASGFLLKHTPPERLVSAVRHVLTGDVLLAPQITTRLVARHAAPAPAGREGRWQR